MTADDFSFVVKALARSSRDSVSLIKLLSDEQERDHILDHDCLFDALLDDTQCLPVSPALYFYVLIRRVLRRAGFEDRRLSDYVAAMLVAFSRMQELRGPGGEAGLDATRNFAYISDLLDAMAKAPPEQIFLLRSHVGNYSLFFSGIFAERVEAHAERRGAPGLSFYEAIGQTSYRTAAQHPHARQIDLRGIFEVLAAEFHAIRLALNRLAENILHFGEPQLPIIGET